jgi:t-SNARE complex subunit (syntaxin)|tara:strand:- start:728 stop:934 length:207 start_codon:yes stop_codon:yes gene_type:complete
LKGREVRAALQGSQDAKVVHCIAEVAEKVSAMEQELNALAQLLNSITDVVAGQSETMEQIKLVAEKRD